MANNNEFQFWDHLTDEEIMGSLESGTFEIPTDILARSLEEQNNFEPTIPPEEQMVQEEEPPQPTSAFEVEKQRDTLPVPEPLGREKPGPEPQAPQQTEEPSLRLGALDQFKGSEPQFVSEMPETQIAPDLEREVADMIQRNLKDETADKQDLTAPTPAAGIAKPAAEFIGGIEAPKGYNQIQGRNKFAPLNEMTLNEVKKFQKAMTSKLGHESSAVGRYQIIGTTLEELMRRMKLTGKEKFTPQLQDRMFNVLLKKRGLNDYLAGEIDEFEFANNLAKEWASLPVVKDMGKRKAGFSYYAGVGSNKSLVDPEDVLGMVRDLREEYQVAQGPQSGGGGGGATEEEELLRPVMQDGKQLLTEEGRPVYENQFGDQVTERTITVPLDEGGNPVEVLEEDKLPEGAKWYNIPTVYDGRFVSDDEAIERLKLSDGKVMDPITGRTIDGFTSLSQAIKSAEARSPDLFTEVEEE